MTFFPTATAFRRWLERHHATAAELWVGMYKKSAGKPTITYQEALDEALAFGWIDGLRKSIDAERWTIRFTPRKATSIWSRVNTRRATELAKLGRMTPAGLAAFAARSGKRSGVYSFETRPRQLSRAYQARFRADRDAWAFFKKQPPGYQRTASFWVMSAKREETRQRRLAELIADSANGMRLAMMTGNGTRSQRR